MPIRLRQPSFERQHLSAIFGYEIRDSRMLEDEHTSEARTCEYGLE